MVLWVAVGVGRGGGSVGMGVSAGAGVSGGVAVSDGGGGAGVSVQVTVALGSAGGAEMSVGDGVESTTPRVTSVTSAHVGVQDSTKRLPTRMSTHTRSRHFDLSDRVMASTDRLRFLTTLHAPFAKEFVRSNVTPQSRWRAPCLRFA
jgi:hypothetical protein